MNRIFQHFSRSWEHRPLQLVLYAALSIRIIAALFSRGYGWHDDHFLTIEPPHSWVHGQDYNNWLPSSHQGAFKPSGHSFTYSGIMFGIFSFLETAGITDPQWQMVFIRLIHALFSLLVVYYGYRIAERLYGMPVARTTGLLLALFYFMPFLSVRNLVEMVCIPFLLGGTWFLLRVESLKWKWVLLSGFFFGMAFSIRYQTVLFTAGTGLVLLFTVPFLRTMAWSLALAATVLITQGLVDYIIWGVPFAEFWEYTTYNQSAGATDYFVREWYMYLVVLAGMLLPPFSVFILSGFVAGFRRALLLSVPVLIFLAFHTWFPNKQERFILPVLPFLLIAGYGGWILLCERKLNGTGWKKVIRISMIFFWSLNILALIPVTLMYSKRSRVETMSWLGKQEDFVSYVIEDSNHSKITMLPDFYSGKGYSSWRIMSDIPATWVHEQLMFLPRQERPNYMLFMFEERVQERMDSVQNYFKLEPVTAIEPSLMDHILHRLNPYNKNEKIVICKIKWE
ncbi:MAG: glycosyltransferase family 39 protein [Bacteroidia bacterium]|nr:glycosyltransferase family 39 protein [Bacteroidia bacterium]